MTPLATSEIAPTRRTRRISEPRGDKVLHAVLLILLSLFTLAIVYPFVYIVSASFSNPVAVSSGQMWLFPVGFSLDAYQTVLVPGNSPRVPELLVLLRGIDAGGYRAHHRGRLRALAQRPGRAQHPHLRLYHHHDALRGA